MTTGLFVHGGSNDQWSGLALSDLNMNGFSITNINTIQILQTETTGQALEVYRNLAAASTDSPIVCFANQNAGDDQSVLTVRTASNAAAANPMVLFEATDAAFDQSILSIIQAGLGLCLALDQNGDVSAMRLRTAATTETNYGMDISSGAGATCAVFTYGSSTNGGFFCAQNPLDADGSFHFKRNLAAAGTAGPLVFIEQDNTGDDQPCIKIQNDGTGNGIFISCPIATSGIALNIDQDGDSYGIQILSAATTNTQYGIRVVTGAGATVANFEYAGTEFARLGIHNAADGSNWFYRNLAAANTAGPVVFIEQDEATDDQVALSVQNDGTGNGIYLNNTGDGTAFLLIQNSTASAALSIDCNSNERAIKLDHDDTGTLASIWVDRDGNNAADIWAMDLTCDNAGAGAPGGIDMTAFASGEALLGVPVDTCTPTANYGAYTVYVNGVGLKLVKLFDCIE